MKIGRNRYSEILITDQEDGLIANITDENYIVEDGYKLILNPDAGQQEKRREYRKNILKGILLGFVLGVLFLVYTVWIINIGCSM